MIDLSTNSGLPLQYDEQTQQLLIKGTNITGKPLLFLDIHTFADDVEAPKEIGQVFKGVGLALHQGPFDEMQLRYDIITLYSLRLGPEWNKTRGHYTPVIPGVAARYPELYEVVHGEGVFIIQKGTNEIEDVLAIRARPGDKIVVPPDYGVTVVNPGKEVLIAAKLQATGYFEEHGTMDVKKGAAYYALVKGDEGDVAYVKNDSYVKVPEITVREPRIYPEFFLLKHMPLYHSFIVSPQKFRFLNHPEEYKWNTQ